MTPRGTSAGDRHAPRGARSERQIAGQTRRWAPEASRPATERRLPHRRGMQRCIVLRIGLLADQWTCRSDVSTRLVSITRFPLLFALCAAVAPISACGSPGTAASSEEQRAERVMRNFMLAAARRDGSAACRLLDRNGQALMAAYPSSAGRMGSASSCQDTVNRLDRLPRADEWKSLARGTIIVSPAAGFDNSVVTVTYQAHGHSMKATGSAQPQLGSGDFLITAPPTPG
jgi:hypothetical protein